MEVKMEVKMEMKMKAKMVVNQEIKFMKVPKLEWQCYSEHK